MSEDVYVGTLLACIQYFTYVKSTITRNNGLSFCLTLSPPSLATPFPVLGPSERRIFTPSGGALEARSAVYLANYVYAPTRPSKIKT